jgi:hypothetical protein
MAWTPAKDKGAYASKGGGIIKIKEVNDDGSDLTTPGTIYDVGYLQETNFSDNTPTTPIKDEHGDTIVNEEGDRDVIVSGVLMQRDKLTLDMAKECRGKFYALMKYNGIINGKYQEIFYAVGQIDPSFDVKLQGGTTPFKFTATKVNSAITIASASLTASFWNTKTSTTVTIAADDYYTIVETTVT